MEAQGIEGEHETFEFVTGFIEFQGSSDSLKVWNRVKRRIPKVHLALDNFNRKYCNGIGFPFKKSRPSLVLVCQA